MRQDLGLAATMLSRAELLTIQAVLSCGTKNDSSVTKAMEHFQTLYPTTGAEGAAKSILRRVGDCVSGCAEAGEFPFSRILGSIEPNMLKMLFSILSSPIFLVQFLPMSLASITRLAITDFRMVGLCRAQLYQKRPLSCLICQVFAVKVRTSFISFLNLASNVYGMCSSTPHC